MNIYKMEKRKKNIDLKVARVRKNLSQDKLSKKINLSKQGYSNIETNKYDTSVLNALKLANVLDTTVEDIFKLKKEDE